MTAPSRRRFLGTMLAAAGGVAIGTPTWIARPAVASPGPFGPLLPADANGWALPAGFTSRVVATTDEAVAATGHLWHRAPDGGACFPTPTGGWIYVSNAEVYGVGGGVGAVEFAADGSIVDARTLLTGTTGNCAGGPTPWGTWLSCEETELGRVFECDPTGAIPPVELPALGRFQHEAAAVDPIGGFVYLTEDRPDGCLYRFVPDVIDDLSSGVLQVLGDTPLRWIDVPDPSGASQPTRHQVPEVHRFSGGEGAWFADGVLWFTTKGDNRVWRLVDGAGPLLEVVYDRATATHSALGGVDNVTVDEGGLVYVAEDGGNMEICVLVDGGAVPVARLEGVSGSELTGPAFSPDGTRLYVSSQRNPGRTYEISGPFDAAPFSCEMTVQPDGTGLLTWSDRSQDTYYVRRRTTTAGQTEESFVASVQGLDLAVPDPSGTWIVRYWQNGTAVDAECEGPPPTFTATMDVQPDGSGLLSWNDEGQSETFVRRRQGGGETFVGSTTGLSLAVPDPAGTWIARYWRDGTAIDAVAEGPSFDCAMTVLTDGSGRLDWTPHGQGTTYIRRILDGEETYVGATAESTYFVPDPVGSWIVRYWSGGTAVDATCDGPS